MYLRISTSYNICHIFSEPNEAQVQFPEETTTDPSLVKSDIDFSILLSSMLFNVLVGTLFLQLGLLAPLGFLLLTKFSEQAQVLLENLELPVEITGPRLPVQEIDSGLLY